MGEPTLGAKARQKIRELVILRDQMVEEILKEPNSIGNLGQIALDLLPYIPNNPVSKRVNVEQIVNGILISEIQTQLAEVMR